LAIEPPSCSNSLSIPCFSSTFDSSLVLAQIDESSGKTSPVRDTGEKQFGGLIELVLEALLSDFQNVRDVRHTKEVLHIVQTVSLGICVRQLRVNLGLPKRFTGHLKEANKVIMFASMTGYLNNFAEVRWILSFDI